MATPTTDTEAILRLSKDSTLLELRDHVPELSLFGLLGRERSELTHSAIIAAVVDPRRHRQAHPALRGLLEAVGRELAGSAPSTFAALQRVMAATWTKVRVFRELFQIDVVVEIVSETEAIVLGVENKIDAAEQHKQVARYQEALASAYPSKTTLVAFLSPDKRAPTTADPSSAVPVVAVDYETILAAVLAGKQAAPAGSGDFYVLGEIAKHIREELMGDHRIRELARQLWRDHPRALWLAIEHRPRLGDIQAEYEARVRTRFQSDAHLAQYPSRGDIREIKLRLKSWVSAGFPFEIMFHADVGQPPRLRVLIWSDAFDKRKSALRKWAKEVNTSQPGLLDEDFTALPNWDCWRRVFLEDDDATSSVLQAADFDIDTVNEAESRLVALVERLGPLLRS